MRLNIFILVVILITFLSQCLSEFLTRPWLLRLRHFRIAWRLECSDRRDRQRQWQCLRSRGTYNSVRTQSTPKRPLR